MTTDPHRDHDHDPSPEDERCRVVRVPAGGQQRAVVVRGDRPLDATDQAALGRLVEAVERLVDQRDPQWGVRQELLRAVRVAVSCIPDGPIRTPLHRRDGATVKQELRDAARAAVAALAPPPGPRAASAPGPAPTEQEDDR